MQEIAERARLTSAIELSMYLPQVPSPAQAATVGWPMLWCIRDSSMDWLILCIAACFGSALNDLPYKLYWVAKCTVKQKAVDTSSIGVV